MDKELRQRIDNLIDGTNSCIDEVMTAKEQFDAIRSKQAALVIKYKGDMEALIQPLSNDDLLEIIPDVMKLAERALEIGKV